MGKLKRYTIWAKGQYAGSYRSTSVREIELVLPQQLAKEIVFWPVEIHYCPEFTMVVSKRGLWRKERYDASKKYAQSNQISRRLFRVDRRKTERAQLDGSIDREDVILVCV